MQRGAGQVPFAIVLSGGELEARSIRAFQEATMRLSVKTIATAAFAVLLLPAFNLFGSEAAIVPTSAANSDPTSAVAIDAVVVAPEPAMQADSATTAMPRSGGLTAAARRWLSISIATSGWWATLEASTRRASCCKPGFRPPRWELTVRFRQVLSSPILAALGCRFESTTE